MVSRHVIPAIKFAENFLFKEPNILPSLRKSRTAYLLAFKYPANFLYWTKAVELFSFFNVFLGEYTLKDS